jgi:hypothetical protein
MDRGEVAAYVQAGLPHRRILNATSTRKRRRTVQQQPVAGGQVNVLLVHSAIRLSDDAPECKYATREKVDARTRSISDVSSCYTKLSNLKKML